MEEPQHLSLHRPKVSRHTPVFQLEHTAGIAEKHPTEQEHRHAVEVKNSKFLVGKTPHRGLVENFRPTYSHRHGQASCEHRRVRRLKDTAYIKRSTKIICIIYRDIDSRRQLIQSHFSLQFRVVVTRYKGDMVVDSA
jgi:hypothetical protein